VGLARLHQLPIDVLKIDRSFVSQYETSKHHRLLVEATVCDSKPVAFATWLDARIAAENRAGRLGKSHLKLIRTCQ